MMYHAVRSGVLEIGIGYSAAYEHNDVGHDYLMELDGRRKCIRCIDMPNLVP